ncbi:hypothetical protein CCM_09021 [Cordyceps militaris CM01]|uniref:Uncharacterized protein n=1 Tax=Cordyceps militaris (strain CM01) TaxID=983644 RepID=G3JSX8_CORMM|nr:uncharacterized protein CCM_09021 [Cordyceps militaris CM01]EGX88974.1 hypothetical protein CCM_09021 [Cordyceps militaris CM01]
MSFSAPAHPPGLRTGASRKSGHRKWAAAITGASPRVRLRTNYREVLMVEFGEEEPKLAQDSSGERRAADLTLDASRPSLSDIGSDMDNLSLSTGGEWGCGQPISIM